MPLISASENMPLGWGRIETSLGVQALIDILPRYCFWYVPQIGG
jgi:hypothetical protein